MDYLSIITIDLYSIVLLLCIYVQTYKIIESGLLDQKLYKRMLQTTILLLVLDIFSRFDGKSATAYIAMNHIANFLMFIVNLLLPSLWLMYSNYQVFHEKKKLRRLLYPLILINVVNAVMLVISQYAGWLYYIDLNNIYHRGPLYWFPVCITIILIAVSLVTIVVNHKKIENKYIFQLVIFPIPPLICVILQTVFYGTSFILSGITISLLILFLNIQNHSLNIDYHTGAYNRRGLELYMAEKINLSTEEKMFSAIWIDLDDFKLINDTFGHNTGDHVLVTTAKLLKCCIKPTDFIARFGGDEFFIGLDISNKEALEEVVERIKESVINYNERNANRYKLSLSMGYAVYTYQTHLKAEDFLKQIDELMYIDKYANKKKKIEFEVT